MAHRVFNFSAGPSTLPLAVMEEAQAEFLDFQGTGMSVMEMSHRSKPYDAVHLGALQRFKDVFAVPETHDVIFMQGGASLQFDLVPMNFLPSTKSADYVITGTWAQKALKEANLIGRARAVATSKETGFDRIPTGWTAEAGSAYVHITTNNTVAGTQFQSDPDTGSVPLVADMSSDILSRPVDFAKYALIYAGAQKNLGPSGATVVVANKAFLGRAKADLPTWLKYGTHLDGESRANTPPTFAIYMVYKVLGWLQAQGGVEGMAARNREKAKIVYDLLDAQPEFFKPHAQTDSRSVMNITFRLPSEELEGAFVKAAVAQGLVGLKGHRSVGGIRASLYNAMPVEGARSLGQFMSDFRNKHA